MSTLQTTRMRTRSVRRAIAGVLLGIITTTALTSCGLPLPFAKKGGTAEELLALVESTEGVSEANLEASHTLSGFTRRWHIHLDITLADGYGVADADATMEWMLATAWALNEERPTVAVSLHLDDTADVPVEWPWQDTLTAQRFDPARVGESYPGSGNIRFFAKDLEEVLGPWPGEVPEPPGDIFQPVP